MEYLKTVFNDYLNQGGVVEIAGIGFSRDNILQTMDEEGYELAFKDWIEERKQRGLEKGEEILRLYDNRDRFRKLKEIYTKGSIVPFVGAGMSIPSGYPGWTSFLYSLLQETRINPSELTTLIDGGKYEEAAELLFNSMPNGSFFEAIENKFGCIPQIEGPIQKLPYMFQNMVITTNFDEIIERVYQAANIKFDEIKCGTEGHEVPRLLGEGKRVLIKLHGKASSYKQRILTKTEYDTYYSTGSTLESVIETISYRTLLFLGCSLSLDRTLDALACIAKRKGHENIPRHYAFLRLKDENERLDRRDHLSKSNIYPIWFPERDDPDECIEALLWLLEDGVN